MSDKLENNQENSIQNKENSLPVKKRGKGILIGWIFIYLFAIVALAVAILSAAYVIDNNKNIAKQGVILENTLTQKITNNSSQVTSLNTQVNDLTGNLKKLQDQIKELLVYKASIANVQISELVSTANQLLTVYQDIPGAIKLLNYTQNVLRSYNEDQFAELRLAIASDLTKLNQVSIIDVTKLTASLNSIDTILDNATLVTINSIDGDNSNNSKSDDINKTNLGWFQIFWQNIKNDLSKIITINKSEQNQALLLLPRDIALIKQSALFLILSIHLALIQHDQLTWSTNLKKLSQLIKIYFINDANIDTAQATINDLLTQNIQLQQITIDSTLLALAKINNSQS